jgi:hypothetical protein
MAQKVSVQLYDDLDGTVINDKGETVAFGIDGVSYEIDLSEKNANALRKALEKYVANGRRTSPAKRGRPKGSGNGSTTRRDPAQTAAIKSWGAENGFKVPARGRLPKDLTDAYEAAHASE